MNFAAQSARPEVGNSLLSGLRVLRRRWLTVVGVVGVSAWSSASSADCRSASACARATLAAAGSTLACHLHSRMS